MNSAEHGDDLPDTRSIRYAVRIARAVYAFAEGRVRRRSVVTDIRLVGHAYARIDHPDAERIGDRIERLRDQSLPALVEGLRGHPQRRVPMRARRRAGAAVREGRRLARAWLDLTVRSGE